MLLKRGLAIICIAAMALGPLGCVDVPSTGPELPNYMSSYRFINAANDAASADVLVDGASKGSLSTSQATGYQDILAGSRKLALRVGGTVVDEQAKSFDTDRRGTVIIFTKGTAAVRPYVLANERFVYETYGATVPADTAFVRFANGLSDGTNTQAVAVKRVSGTDTLTVVANIEFSKVSGYAKVPAGAHTLVITKPNSKVILSTAGVSVASKKRYTDVVLGTPTAVSFGEFLEQ